MTFHQGGDEFGSHYGSIIVGHYVDQFLLKSQYP